MAFYTRFYDTSDFKSFIRCLYTKLVLKRQHNAFQTGYHRFHTSICDHETGIHRSLNKQNSITASDYSIRLQKTKTPPTHTRTNPERNEDSNLWSRVHTTILARPGRACLLVLVQCSKAMHSLYYTTPRPVIKWDMAKKPSARREADLETTLCPNGCCKRLLKNNNNNIMLL